MVRQPRKSVLLAAVLLAGVAGCGPGDQPSGPPPAAAPPTSAPAASAPAGSGTATPAADFPLTVTRRGGFAGVDDRVAITADGAVVVTRRDRPPLRTALPAATMADLRRLLKAPDLAGPASATGTPAVCNDGYEYEIVSPSVMTSVQDCATSHGATLDRILAIVAAVLDR